MSDKLKPREIETQHQVAAVTINNNFWYLATKFANSMTSYLLSLPFRRYRSVFFKFWTLCVFERLFGGLGTTYDVHLGLTRKRVADFLLVIIELFR